jgi:hypothetical protein
MTAARTLTLLYVWAVLWTPFRVVKIANDDKTGFTSALRFPNALN